MRILSFLWFFIFCSFVGLGQTETNIVLPMGLDTLKGTLNLPPNCEKIILIVLGNGPSDRDGNQLYTKNNAFKQLADSLAAHGIGSLRYDKRDAKPQKCIQIREASTHLMDYAKDVTRWHKWLRAHFSNLKIGYLGYSEGGLYATLAAQENHPSFIVLVAALGRPIDSLIRDQMQSQPPSMAKEVDSLLLRLRNNKEIGLPENSHLHTLFRPSILPFMREWIRYNPADELAKLPQSIASLIIQGDLDLQVKLIDAQLLQSKRPSSKMVIINGMNHVLKPCPYSCNTSANLKLYNEPNLSIHAQLVESVVRFMATQSQN